MRILFPTDFSEAACHAFIYALKMAKKLNADLLTLHVFHRPDVRAIHLPRTLSDLYEGLELEEFEEYRASIQKLHNTAKEHMLDQVPIKHIMAEGEVPGSIIETAKKESADFIVMGTKGAGWLKQIFMGTVAAEVMENASVPVLAVPDEAEFDGKIDKIGVTINFQEEDYAMIKSVLRFAKPFEADVYCINVDVSNSLDLTEREDAFISRFDGVDRLHFEILSGTDIQKSLSEYMEENQIDIIAMLSRKRSFIEEIFHFNQAKKLSYQSKVPVFAFQMRNIEKGSESIN